IAPSVSSRRAIVERKRFSAFTLEAIGRNSGGCAWLVRLVRPSPRSEEHTSELQSLMRISYAVFCLTKKKIYNRELREATHYNQLKHRNKRYTNYHVQAS